MFPKNRNRNWISTHSHLLVSRTQWVVWYESPLAHSWLLGSLKPRRCNWDSGLRGDYEKKWGQRLDQWEAAGVTLPRGTGAGNNAAKAVIAQESAGCSCPNMSRQQINCMKYEPTHREQQLPFTHTHTHTHIRYVWIFGYVYHDVSPYMENIFYVYFDEPESRWRRLCERYWNQSRSEDFVERIKSIFLFSDPYCPS